MITGNREGIHIDVVKTRWIMPLLIACLLSSCSQLDESEIFFECVSPDGEKVATFYRVFGGGAAGYQDSRINLRKVEDQIDISKYFFSMSHGYEVQISWLENDLLQVDYPNYSDIYRANGKVFGTNQSYNSSSIVRVLYTGDNSKFGKFINKKGGCVLIHKLELR